MSYMTDMRELYVSDSMFVKTCTTRVLVSDAKNQEEFTGRRESKVTEEMLE